MKLIFFNIYVDKFLHGVNASITFVAYLTYILIVLETKS